MAHGTVGRERWNNRHQQEAEVAKPPLPIVVESVRERKPGRALDLACGLGRHSLFLLDLGWHVTAVDYSAVAIQHLARHSSGNLVTVLADLEADEFRMEAESYDLILDCCFLYRPLFPAIRRGVTTGGLFVGVFPLEGINPAYCVRSGEVAEQFAGWHILQNSEAKFAEFVAEKHLS